jgi:hypothetical protein
LSKTQAIFSFLFFFACTSFAQKDNIITIHGRITNSSGNSCNEQVLCVNERTETVYVSAKSGAFTMRVHSLDTIRFKAYGYAEKLICVPDSVHKMHYKINVQVEKLIDTANDEDLAKMYSFIVNNLYERFSWMDTAKYFLRQSNGIGEKSDALIKIFGHYINHRIRKMNDGQFYGFIEFLLENGGKELVDEPNKKLIRDTKQYYRMYINQPEGRKLDKSGCNEDSNSKCKGVGCFIIVVYCIVAGMSALH